MGGACGDWIRANALAPRSGCNSCRDAMKYAQNWVGSLSPSSRNSHVTRRGLFGIHSLSKVVLPNPAGAAIKVSFLSSPWVRRSTNLGRKTRSFRGWGIYSFVLRSSTIGPVLDRNSDLNGSPTKRRAKLRVGKPLERARWYWVITIIIAQ